MLAHVLVLADEGEIPDDHEAEPGDEEQKDHRSGQLAPDAEINFHDHCLIARAVEEKKIMGSQAGICGAI